MRRFLVILLCAVSFAARGVAAQEGSIAEGAPEFLRAIGARSLGMGQAVVAGAFGTEAVWANPALVARSRREASFDFRNMANSVEPETDVAGVVIIPGPPVGSMAVFLRYINNGPQPETNAQQVQVGALTPLSFIIGASFATTFFDRLAVGITAKQLRIQFSCTGQCTDVGNESASHPTVSALDLGSQYYVFADSTLSVGASFLNLGPKLQIFDSPQADPLPARGSVGALYSPRLKNVPDVKLRFAADLVARLSGSTPPGLRFGAEASYLERYQLRAGYMRKGAGGIDSPTIGVGITSGRVHVDLSQIMQNLGAEGTRPTFLALHFAF